jgi:hypothetical protein
MEPSQVVAQLQSDVDRYNAHRLPLYLNEKRLADTFELWLTPIKEVLTSEEVGAEISGGFLQFFKIGGSKSVSLGARIELTPMLRVRLLEETARAQGRLVDLANAEPRKGVELLTFVGDGHFVPPWEERLTEVEDLGLKPEEAVALQKERERWEGIQRYEQGDSGTIVWVAAGRLPLASIMGTKSVNWAWIDSHGHPPYGIFGLYGKTISGVLLVTSLFSWHEQKAAG